MVKVMHQLVLSGQGREATGMEGAVRHRGDVLEQLEIRADAHPSKISRPRKNR